MLFVIYGNSLDAKKDLIESYKSKYGLTQSFSLDEYTTNQEALSSFTEEGFFISEPSCIELQHVLGTEQGALCLSYVPLFMKSTNIFVIYEYELSKDHKQFFEKEGVKISEVVEKKVEKEIVSPFVFTDYVLSKDKKNSWIALMHLQQKAEVGQVMAALFWAFKNMGIVVSSETTEATSGMKPFVFKKLKQKSTHWTKEEVSKGLFTLLNIQKEEIFDEQAQYMRLEQYIFSL